MSESADDDDLSEASQLENKSVIYSNLETTKSYALKVFNECDIQFREVIENDPFAKKVDTVAGIVQILKRLKGNLSVTVRRTRTTEQGTSRRQRRLISSGL